MISLGEGFDVFEKASQCKSREICRKSRLFEKSLFVWLWEYFPRKGKNHSKRHPKVIWVNF
jgi:hypothetical protein